MLEHKLPAMLGWITHLHWDLQLIGLPGALWDTLSLVRLVPLPFWSGPWWHTFACRYRESKPSAIQLSGRPIALRVRILCSSRRLLGILNRSPLARRVSAMIGSCLERDVRLDALFRGFLRIIEFDRVFACMHSRIWTSLVSRSRTMSVQPHSSVLFLRVIFKMMSRNLRFPSIYERSE